jgi:hypothetical protein
MIRQGFSNRLDWDEYQTLFRLMSPVMPLYWTMPGHPPVIQHRADFSDFRYNDLLRSRRQIVKARFQNGSVAYVFLDELGLFASLYRKPIAKMNPTMVRVLDLIEHEGPINVRGMKESLSLYVKDISPALQTLQKAFLVFEDQRSSDWDRGFYHFEREFPEINIDAIDVQGSIQDVLKRFAYLMVWFTVDEAMSCYQLKQKDIQSALNALTKSHQLIEETIGGVVGYRLPADLEESTDTEGFFFLNRNDFYSRSLHKELKRRFPKTTIEPMYYLLHHGQIKGAVYGHFRIRPDEVEDIVFDTDNDYLVETNKPLSKPWAKWLILKKVRYNDLMGGNYENPSNHQENIPNRLCYFNFHRNLD